MESPSLIRVNSARFHKSEPSSSSVNRSASSSLFENEKEKVKKEKQTGIEACIKQRRNTLPVQSPQFLSPDRFTFNRTNSYYSRSSPTRRSRSFKSGAVSTTPREDSWDNYSCKFNRKMSLSTSDPLSSSHTQILYNVMILGDLSVGKFSLVNHLIGSDTTLNSKQKFKYHGIKFSLFDKCVEITFEYYQNLSQSSEIAMNKMKTMDMLIVMYSVTDRRSFEISASFLTMATFSCKKLNTALKVCLIANKSDLVRAREVNKKEGELLANKFDVEFMEVSIEYADNFEQVIDWITNCIKEKLDLAEKGQEFYANNIKKNSKLSVKAANFIRRILSRHGSKSKSCDNIFLMR